MTPDDPRHGTQAGYHTHRRHGETPCEPCRTGHRQACKRMRWRTRNGERTIRVPATEALAVFEEAAERGITRHALLQAAGISSSYSAKMFKRQPKTVHPDTVRKLRAALADESLVSGRVDADLTRKRLHSLMAQGWTGQVLNGMTPVEIYSGKWRRTPTVTRDFARAVLALVEQIGDLPGPSPHGRALAARAGYVPLAAWDDPGTLEWPRGWHDEVNEETTDIHPGKEIDHAVVERILSGDAVPANRAERQEVTRRWIARGWPLSELERITGWKVERYGRKGAA